MASKKNLQKYISKEPDAQGLRRYSSAENAVWADLYARQTKEILPGRACAQYLECLKDLALPEERVPQLHEVNETLKAATGWSVEGVPALISFEKFFKLLAARKFPAATFIRTREDFDYLQEPDVFHEIFGHCPLLLNSHYADFMQAYGQMGLDVAPEDQAMLARLYWFTVEFGLIQPSGLPCEIYGAGVVSSVGESPYALSPQAERHPIDLVDVFRRLYRIDIFQPIYYVIEGFEQLYQLVHQKEAVFAAIQTARKLGPLMPTFPVDDLPKNDIRHRVFLQKGQN